MPSKHPPFIITAPPRLHKREAILTRVEFGAHNQPLLFFLIHLFKILHNKFPIPQVIMTSEYNALDVEDENNIDFSIEHYPLLVLGDGDFQLTLMI